MIFALSAFEPTDAELGTGEDEEMGDTERAKKIVEMNDDDDDDAGPVTSKVKQYNRAIVQDSDDESEEKQQREADQTMSSKKAGKQKADGKKDKKAILWSDGQEPSTKMLWAIEEIKRVRRE